MSDAPPPTKPKPGSLRDRIAAFEKKPDSSGTPAPAPPAPRPKPGNLAWKPKPVSPPSSPPPTVTTHSDRPVAGVGGMSASDAKESIGKGGSLKERMAALQGKGAFGAPAPVGPPPRPAGEKPKWKPPPKIASPPTDDEGDTVEPSRLPPAQYINPVRRVSEDQSQSPPPPGETAVAPDSTGGDEDEARDPEEEERQRRAAIAARMARLGGARLGMGPPVFAPKPAFKKPDVPKEVAPVKAEDPDVEPVKSTDPTSSAAAGDGDEPTKSPTTSKDDRQDSSDSLPTRKDSALSSLSTESSSTPARSPASMPVPAVPRRAGPPRKKSAKGAVTPQPAQVIGEEGALKESPAGTPSLHAANAPATVDTLAEVADVLGGAEKEVPQEEKEEHADDITGEAKGNKETDDSHLAYMSPETPEQDDPEPPAADHKHVHAEAVVEAYGTPASISVVAAPSSAPIEREHTEEFHEEGEASPSEAQTEVAPTDDVHAGTEEAAPEVAKEVEKGDEDEEDDPATHRKRVAGRLAKMGAVNPFAARPIPVHQSSEDSKPERKDSVGSAASPTSPVSQRRKASAISIESSPIAGTQHQVSPPSSPVVRKSQGSRKASTMSVEAPRESPRRPSVDPASAIIHEPSHASPSAEEAQEYSEEPARRTYEQDDDYSEPADSEEEQDANKGYQQSDLMVHENDIVTEPAAVDPPSPPPAARAVPPPLPPVGTRPPVPRAGTRPASKAISAPVSPPPSHPPRPPVPHPIYRATPQGVMARQETASHELPTPSEEIVSSRESPVVVEGGSDAEDVAIAVEEEQSSGRGEVLDEAEGDPIDPDFHAPSRRQSYIDLNTAGEVPEPPAQRQPSPEPEIDSEQARRRTIAERMAKLGGIKFGAAPPMGRLPPRPAHEEPAEKEEKGPETQLTEEEEEQARKQRIAAKLASMGGMRFGMMPPGVGPSRQQNRPEREASGDSGVTVSPQPPPPVPPSRPPPSHRPPPPPQMQLHDSELDTLATSDDGVEVEAEESEPEEVGYEEVEEAKEVQPVPPAVPPPRPAMPHPHRAQPQVPDSRPPVPVASPVRRKSTQPSSPPFSYPPRPTYPPQPSEYVLVDTPASLDEADLFAPRPTSVSAPPARGVPPPPPPPVAQQWELPSIPSGGFDFGGTTPDLSLSTFSEDSTTYPESSAAPQPPPLASAGPPSRMREASAPSQHSEVQLSPEELMSIWARVGVQISEAASRLHDKSKKTLVGDGSFSGFVLAVLTEVPNAHPPTADSYGYLIYAQSGAAVQRRVSEILPGDVIVLSDAKLKGHKGLQSYQQHVGAGEMVVGIVTDWDAKKSKVKVLQANQHVGQQAVESVNYRLEDLKSGSIKIFRVLEA